MKSTIKVTYDANDEVFTTFTKHHKFTFNNSTGEWHRHSADPYNGPHTTEHKIHERYVQVQHRQALRNHAVSIGVKLINKNTSPRVAFASIDLANVPQPTLYENLTIIQDINKKILELNRESYNWLSGIREFSTWGSSLHVLASKLMVWTIGSPLIKISKTGGLRMFFTREFPQDHLLWSRLEVTKTYGEAEI